MSENLDQLVAQFSDAISTMPESFDTHRFIRDLARTNQKLYIQALAESDSDTPFMAVHALIGKTLKKRHDLEEVSTQVLSKDIFGQSSTCSKWHKK